MKDELLSTKEVASFLGVSVSRVRQLAIALGLTRKGRDWYFNRKDIEQIAAKRGIKLKAQRKKRSEQ